MQQLDQLDKRILWELGHNGRRSVSDLGRILKQSRERIAYRISRLEEREIISGYVTTLNPHLLGYDIYKTYLRVENNRPMVEKLCRHIRAHDRLAWFGICDGSWDIAFCLYAVSAKEFHDLHVKILSEFNPVVLNFAAYCLTDIRMYEQGYLWRGNKNYSRIGGGRERVELNLLDIAILRQLHNDGRTTISELSDRLNTTHATIHNHISRMEKLEVITGYKVMVNLEKLGLQCIKTMFFLRNYELKLREEFIEFCDQNPYITCYTEQIGDCNLELEIEAPDTRTYSDLITEIRQTYSKLIKNFNTMLLRETVHQWLPKDLEKRFSQSRKTTGLEFSA